MYSLHNLIKTAYFRMWTYLVSFNKTETAIFPMQAMLPEEFPFFSDSFNLLQRCLVLVFRLLIVAPYYFIVYIFYGPLGSWIVCCWHLKTVWHFPHAVYASFRLNFFLRLI